MRAAIDVTTGEITNYNDDIPVTAIEDPNASIDAQIVALEGTVTQRRLREAALTDAGRAWLADVDARIAVLRSQRV